MNIDDAKNIVLERFPAAYARFHIHIHPNRYIWMIARPMSFAKNSMKVKQACLSGGWHNAEDKAWIAAAKIINRRQKTAAIKKQQKGQINEK